MLDQLNPVIDELDRAVQQQAESHADAARLMTHPDVGPVTALAFVLTLGPMERFQRSKQVVSYLGLNPKERSSGGQAAYLRDQQAGQHHDALVAGGSGTNSGAVRS